MDEARSHPEADVLRDVARSIGLEVASFLVEERPGTLRTSAKSSPTDIVTQMDVAAEGLIRSLVGERRPADGILGEEGSESAGTSGIVWVVDPIDGTVNYLYGLPWWTVSIAACVGDRAVAGAVVAPGLDWVATASAGGGAVLETRGASRPLRVSGCVSPPEALIATGFGYDSDRRGQQGSAVARLLPKVRDIRRAGAASLDLCLVAAGMVDGYFERGLKPWDLAAGGLIARESGGVVCGMGGGPAGEDMVVAAGPGLMPGLLALLDAVGAGDPA